MPARYIDIKGARQHNLKNVDLQIMHGKLTVVSGVSGSGKSSLAFDTIFAEGQRRFVESQSTYARQFLQRLDKPDVDSIQGLRPTIAVQARNTHKSARSTVGTVTEIYDYLRLLFSKIGKLHCPDCGKPVKAATVDEMIEETVKKFDGEKAYVLAPIIVSQAMTADLMKDSIRARGYSYIFSEGEAIDLETATDERVQAALDAAELVDPDATEEEKIVHIIVDRLKISSKKKTRIVDSFETALKESGNVFSIITVGGELLRFSTRAQCLDCELEIKRPTPQELSFNSALGACPHCKGFGDVYQIDMDAIVPDRSKTLRQGALECWETSGIKTYAHKMFKKPLEEIGVRTDVPFSELTDEEVERLMKGYRDLYGLEQFFERMKEKSYKISNRYFLMRYRKLSRCRQCGGARLNPVALSTKIGGLNIAELGMMPVSEVFEFFKDFKPSEFEQNMVKLPLREIVSRTGYLSEIGLGYITLWRLSRTLSGGEMQRIHLAGYLGSRLTGTLYVLDEPTVGLHPRDTDRLIRVLKDLRDLGNTIIVVEHDMQVIASADRVLEMGPGPGDHGGESVFSGTIKQFKSKANTLTSDFLNGKISVADFHRMRRSDKSRNFLTIKNATHNNLKNIDPAFPVNRFSCVTGVSGSGKSSLVCDVLHEHAEAELKNANSPGRCDGLDGMNNFNFVEMMGQDPIGKNPRANALTYIDIFGPIRQLFAATQDARRRGFGPGHFSFNTRDGRCPKCEGTGFIQIDMQFLADVYVKCDECDGRRYLPRIQDVKYEGKSIGDVLEMTVDEVIVFFKNSTPVVNKLLTLQDVGLGYLRIGQPLNTLSAGEAQRLKIARELNSSGKGLGLFIFDEPTMGLHPHEVSRFLKCVDRLISAGHTVVVIEHNMDVIAQADYIIDLGPEGGSEGGQIIASGTPAEIAKAKKSITGEFLKEYIEQHFDK